MIPVLPKTCLTKGPRGTPPDSGLWSFLSCGVPGMRLVCLILFCMKVTSCSSLPSTALVLALKASPGQLVTPGYVCAH